jgi:H+/Cl- antiporter ClcA
MEWISIIAFAIILLGVISRGGDWFDVLDGNARFENSWISFEFGMTFVVLLVLVGGLIAFLLILSFKNSVAEQAMSQPVPAVHQTRQPLAHAIHKTTTHTHKRNSK